MPASHGTTQTRRRILRFGLESLRIDGRPNAYKQPQLVLKPQLELAPRRPFTGSRPRLPLWRHFLMVHVKDKADELVNLDLDLFKQSSPGIDSALRHIVTCSMLESSLIFHYPKSAENVLSTLEVKLQNAADLNTIIEEFRTLGVKVETEQRSLISNVNIASFTLRPSEPSGQGTSPAYMPSSSSRTLDSSSPLPADVESHMQEVLLHRPLSQPLGQSTTGWQADPRSWSPAFVPSRPATALGVPGILGEGIYKVSKVGSIASNRQRMRRASTILEHRGPRLYTVSKHFDKTINREDILRSSRSRYMQRALYLNPQGGTSTTYPTRSPSLTSGLMARPASAFSQTETALGSGGHLDDISLVGSSQTLAESSADDETTADDWLLWISQIQHHGFCEASKLWEDFTAEAEAEKCSTAPALDEILAKLKTDFAHQWEELVNATAEKVRGGWHARVAF